MSTVAPVGIRTQDRSGPVRRQRASSGPGRSLPRSRSDSAVGARACIDVRTAAASDLGAATTMALIVAFSVLVTAALVVAGVVLWQASSPLG